MVIKALNEDIETKRQAAIKKLADEMAEEYLKLEELKSIENILRKDIKNLQEAKKASEIELTAYEISVSERLAERAAIIAAKDSYQGKIDKSKQEIDQNTRIIADLKNEIAELITTQRKAESDKEVLQAEITTIENKVIELEASYKARKKTYTDELTEIKAKLQDTLDKLEAAYKEDKSIRAAWTEEHIKLDRERQSLQHMKTRLSGAEQRIQELDKYI